MSRDDAVVEDEVDVGLGGEAAQSACVVFRDRGLDGGDAEVLVAPEDMGSGGGDAGFGVAGDGGVAIEDEVAMGRDAGGVDLGGVQLGVGETGEEEYKDCEKNIGVPGEAETRGRCNRDAKNLRRFTASITVGRTRFHLVVALRYASAAREFA